MSDENNKKVIVTGSIEKGNRTTVYAVEVPKELQGVFKGIALASDGSMVLEWKTPRSGLRLRDKRGELAFLGGVLKMEGNFLGLYPTEF